MSTTIQQIMALITASPGLTDREITNLLHGPDGPQQPVNSACRSLAVRGLISRIRRFDGLLGNYPAEAPAQESERLGASSHRAAEGLAEDEVKRILVQWLQSQGWQTRVKWGSAHGVDIIAKRGSEKWLIEAKGGGSRPEMRVNYFLGVLGETLQRMDDLEARYSIALPDLKQFRRLWERLPSLAKSRTHITAIFVSSAGVVTHCDGS